MWLECASCVVGQKTPHTGPLFFVSPGVPPVVQEGGAPVQKLRSIPVHGCEHIPRRGSVVDQVSLLIRSEEQINRRNCIHKLIRIGSPLKLFSAQT